MPKREPAFDQPHNSDWNLELRTRQRWRGAGVEPSFLPFIASMGIGQVGWKP